MRVIANTTIISNFATVGHLHLLKMLWNPLYISEQVFSEIQAGFNQGYSFYAGIEQHIFPLSPDGWLHLTSLQSTDEFRLYGQLLGKLHDGEASCLSIAHHRHWTFLSDDRATRQKGQQLKVPISGTLGALLLLVKRQNLSLPDANALLQEMITIGGYYSPVTSLNEILKL